MDAFQIEYPTDWIDYELIDSGDREKLERFGPYTVIRPDPRILWAKSNPLVWKSAQARHVRPDAKTGQWIAKTPPPNPWVVSYKHLTFHLKSTEFKHVGLFPEQAANWDWLSNHIHARPMNVLNLFAYTGGASLAAAASGAHVTHVDSMKSVISWAKENTRASNLDKKPIRWIEDDAYKFVLREARRGATYDGIIMDPPRFGRGTKGEVWKFEEDVPRLLAACLTILSTRPSFVLMNAYTADISSVALGNLMGGMTLSLGGTTNFGELAIRETIGGRLVPHGIFARWAA